MPNLIQIKRTTNTTVNDAAIEAGELIWTDNAVSGGGANGSLYIGDTGGSARKIGGVGTGAVGQITAVAGMTDNNVLTATGATTLTGESALTFDGLTLAVTGDATISDDLSLNSDSAELTFGGNSEVKLIHNHDKGLILKHTATADNTPISLVLQTGEVEIASGEPIGKIHFQAPDEESGTDAVLVAAGIEAVSTGAFGATDNPTKLSFLTGKSEAASEKMSLDEDGDLALSGDLTVSGGDITLGTTSIFSGGDTTSLNNIDSLDATTEATVEAAIDTLANLTSVQGRTVTLGANFTLQNNNLIINLPDNARTLTFYESLTVGNGSAGTLTFSAASKTLTVEDNATVNQDLTSDASPTFAGVTSDLVQVGVTAAGEIDTSSGNLTINSAGGTVTVDDNLIVSGDLTINGTNTVVDTTNLVVEDNMIKLAKNNNAADAVDIGFYGLCDPAGIDTYTGLIRDANDQEWHLFDLLQDEPASAGTMNIAGTGFDHADLTLGALTADDFSSFTTGLQVGSLSATANLDIGSYSLTAQTLVSDVATGTAPLTVSSTTLVTNLNADKLDGQDGSYYTDFSNMTVSDDEIPIAKLASDSVSFGGVSVTLGASDATPAFNLADATGYLTTNLSGTITNTQLAGSIADSKLSTISTAGKVDIGALDIVGASEMGAALVDADLFIVDDGAVGTEKSMLASRIPTYVAAATMTLTNSTIDGGTF